MTLLKIEQGLDMQRQPSFDICLEEDNLQIS